MPEINFGDLSWNEIKLILVPMPDGSYESTLVLYDVKGLPEGVQGFTMYGDNPISYSYNVIGINAHLTYPPVNDKFTYVLDHEIEHVKNKQRPRIRDLPPEMEEYYTRKISDRIYHEKTGEHVNTAEDLFDANDYNEYANRAW